MYITHFSSRLFVQLEGSTDEKLDPDAVTEFLQSESWKVPFFKEGSKYKQIFDTIKVQNLFMRPSTKSIDNLKSTLLEDGIVPAENVQDAYKFYVETVLRIMNGLEKG